MRYKDELNSFILSSGIYQSTFTGRRCKPMDDNVKINFNLLSKAYYKGGYDRETWIDACDIWSKSDIKLVNTMSETILKWMELDDKYGKSQYK